MALRDAIFALLIPALALAAPAPVPGARDGATPSSADAMARSGTVARALADRIAARYGAEGFKNVESIRFTFNERHGSGTRERRWTWFPKQDSVLYSGEDAKGLVLQAAYCRKNKFSLSSETVAGIEKSFLNDQCWLLFPLHLAWDDGIELESGPGGALRVRYPASGEVYDLIADADGTIKSWTVHRNTADTSAIVAGWSKPKPVDGLPLSLERKGKDGFKIWFTDVKVAWLK